jgi:hypothetical protein
MKNIWEIHYYRDGNPNTDMKKKTCEYVEASTLVPEAWNSFWGVISENAPFSWGDNNRSLVTASDFKRHVVARMDVCEPDAGEPDETDSALEEPILFSEYMTFLYTLDELGETYIDLEN